MFRKEIFDHEIDCINPTDFELLLTLHVKKGLLEMIFNKTRSRILRKKNMEVKGNPDSIDNFDVPVNYYKILKLQCKKLIKIVSIGYKKDGIELLNYDVTGARFIKNKSSNWNIKIRFKGVYTDKR